MVDRHDGLTYTQAMSGTKEARRGLAYIMDELSASRWSESEGIEPGYIISIDRGRGQYQDCFVSLDRVEAAEKDLQYDMPPMRWVTEGIIPKPRTQSPTKRRKSRGR